MGAHSLTYALADGGGGGPLGGATPERAILHKLFETTGGGVLGGGNALG